MGWLMALAQPEARRVRNNYAMNKKSIMNHSWKRLNGFLPAILMVFVFSIGAYADMNLPAGEDYKVDTSKSIIHWKCDNHDGVLKIKEGSLIVENGKIAGGEFKIKMNSIKNNDIENDLMRGTLENILKSKDFFHVEKYPEATFTITNSEKKADGSYWIAGDLKLLNKSRRICFNADVLYKDNYVEAETETFSIDRTKWGVTTYSPDYAKSDASFIVSNSIDFTIHLVAEP